MFANVRNAMMNTINIAPPCESGNMQGRRIARSSRGGCSRTRFADEEMEEVEEVEVEVEDDDVDGN